MGPRKRRTKPGLIEGIAGIIAPFVWIIILYGFLGDKVATAILILFLIG